MEGFKFESPPPPTPPPHLPNLWKFQFSVTVLLKTNLCFKNTTSPSEFSITLQGVGKGVFCNHKMSMDTSLSSRRLHVGASVYSCFFGINFVDSLGGVTGI